MPRTLWILYIFRRLFFALFCCGMTVVIWLLMADLIMRDPIGAIMIKLLKMHYGFTPMYAHGIRGAMAVYPETRMAHWTITLVGLGLFLLSQYLFLDPGRGWLKKLHLKTALPSTCIAMAAFPAALLTVGAMTTVIDGMGLWRTLPGPKFYAYGCIWFPPTLIIWFSLLTFWGLWWIVLNRCLKHQDRYMQLLVIVYVLFICAGLEMMVAGLMHVDMYGFMSRYWLSGTYTGLLISGSVFLWCMGPALTLLYASKHYYHNRVSRSVFVPEPFSET